MSFPIVSPVVKFYLLSFFVVVFFCLFFILLFFVWAEGVFKGKMC